MSDIPHIKLSQLTRRIEEAVKRAFGAESYWIVAEVSGHKFYADQGRHYFEFIEKAEGLADPVAKLRAVSWKSGSEAIRGFEAATGQVFGNGLQVLVKVRVEFHPLYGLSLVLQDIDSAFTLGNMEKQRRDTLSRLVADNPGIIEQVGEGYVTANKKAGLPIAIQKIAVIGSVNSEGFVDFSHTIASNRFGYRFSIDVYASSVQGAGAQKELAARLVEIFLSGKSYDCVVMIRGGGSKSDFLVFDGYGLAKAVAGFPIPIVTGIGHHKDVSIVDMMAHTGTKTPTKAAEFIISHNRQFEDQVLVLQKNVVIRSQQLLSGAHRKINANNSFIINRARSVLYSRNTSLALLSGGMKMRLPNYFVSRAGQIDHYQALIRVMSPESVLRKGFAIVSEGGKILARGEGVRPGAEIEVRMWDYEIKTVVISKTKNDGTGTDL